ncbi:MAG: GntR family transcriptional regulator [Burkholderiales bacterium]|nr:GntR family transcriptional regulator [Burkholderiales bacterium]
MLADELARFLQSEIVFGEIAPGARLTEEDISARYGLSRSPVREAFRLLAADGLVVLSARRGIRVTPVSRRDLAEVQGCRIELEGLAAFQAAEHAAAADVAELQAIVEKMAAALSAGDVRGYFSQNVAFTTRIHLATGNLTLMRLLDGIGKQALRYRYIAYQKLPELMRVSLPGSRRILAAIRAHDAPRAREITATLIRNSWAAIEPHIPADDCGPG